MVREDNGQYDSIRTKFVKLCNLSGSRELQFHNLQKASRLFDRNLTQSHAEKIISKINKKWNILHLQISFSSMLQEFKMLYILGGRFHCRSLEALIFCFLVSFSAVYSSVNIQSYFQLLYSVNMGIISLFIEV